jgi:hypothetical protein
MRLRIAALLNSSALIAAVLWPGAPALAQQCTRVGANQTCTNSINLSGPPSPAIGLQDTGTAQGLTVTNTNTGTISGTNDGFFEPAFGIEAVTATVTNNGTISGTATGPAGMVGIGIGATTATVTNTGTISGTATGRGGAGFGI